MSQADFTASQEDATPFGRSGLASLTQPSWFGAYLLQKNTFLELVPPLSESVMGFHAWRRQTSDPTTSTPSSPATSEDFSLTPQRSASKADSGIAEEDTSASSKDSAGSDKQDTSDDRDAFGDCDSLDSRAGVAAALNPAASFGSGQPGAPDLSQLVRRVRGDTQIARRMEAKDPSALLTLVPLGEDGRPTSIGSTAHATGSCRPCAYTSSLEGCDSGVLCRFCHFDHPQSRKVRARACKGKRDRYRNLVIKLFAKLDQNPDTFDLEDEQLPPSIRFDARMKAKLVERMSEHVEQVRQQRGAVHDRTC